MTQSDIKTLLKFIAKRGALDLSEAGKTVLAMIFMIIFIAVVLPAVSLITGLVLWTVSFGQIATFGGIQDFGWTDLTVIGFFVLMLSGLAGAGIKELCNWSYGVKMDYREFKRTGRLDY